MVSTESRGSTTALTVFNLPQAITEDYVHSLFPTAQYVNMRCGQADPTNSQGMCVLQFNSPYECQKAYAECREGKEVAGRMLHAELGEGSGRRSVQTTGNYGDSQYAAATNPQRPNLADSMRQTQRSQSDSNSRREDGRTSEAGAGCSLSLSNLPYGASESDILNEFPEALKVVLNLDERGRSRGTAQVSFSSKEQCSAACDSCSYKVLQGRPIRARISRENENGQGRQNDQRGDYGGRQSGGGRYNSDQRDFGGRSNRYGDEQRSGFGGGRQGRYGEDQNRDYGNRQGSQGNYNRDNNRYGNTGGSYGGNRGGGGSRGSYGGGGGGFRGGNRGGNRFGNDSFGGRRDRSPGRDEPVRGYGDNKGKRITSAVINRPGDRSPASSSSSSSSYSDD